MGFPWLSRGVFGIYFGEVCKWRLKLFLGVAMVKKKGEGCGGINVALEMSVELYKCAL